jgi:Uma2 family endonuclease
MLLPEMRLPCEIGDKKLLIEIIVTSGTISKLDLYKALGIDEVWFWEDGVLNLYHLTEGDYQPVDCSQIPALHRLDISILSQCILLGETNWNLAVREFRAAHPV